MSSVRTVGADSRATSFGRRRWSACVLAFAFSVSACDPTWGYHVRSNGAVQAGGLRYDLASENPKVRLYAGLRLDRLSVELTLTNVGAQPLDLVGVELQAFDTKGTPLGPEAPGRWTCATLNDRLVVAVGASCTVTRVFVVEPHAAGEPWRGNPDLARISVRLATADPKAFPDISVLMER